MRTLLGLIREPEESQNLIKYLLDLARDLRANVLFMYIENPVRYPIGTPDSTGVAMVHLQKSLDTKITEGRKILEETVSRMMPRLAGKVAVEIAAKLGNERTILKELVSSGKVQMLAMEYKSLDVLRQKDAFTSDVIRTIDRPVWVIPEQSEYHGIKHIIYATDYHEEDISTLNKLIDLTHQLSPKISAMHITDNVDFELRVKNAGFQKMLESKTEYNDISVKALVEKSGDDLVKLIVSYAAMNNADLIVVLKENNNFLERFFNPSSSEKIIHAADKPVLVYHATEDN